MKQSVNITTAIAVILFVAQYVYSIEPVFDDAIKGSYTVTKWVVDGVAVVPLNPYFNKVLVNVTEQGEKHGNVYLKLNIQSGKAEAKAEPTYITSSNKWNGNFKVVKNSSSIMENGILKEMGKYIFKDLQNVQWNKLHNEVIYEGKGTFYDQPAMFQMWTKKQ